ncbi:hypothetical protein N9X78_07225 [Amylibacter sp.]|nr:hypothetical protein [Amylibacter sp.]
MLEAERLRSRAKGNLIGPQLGYIRELARWRGSFTRIASEAPRCSAQAKTDHSDNRDRFNTAAGGY